MVQYHQKVDMFSRILEERGPLYYNELVDAYVDASPYARRTAKKHISELTNGIRSGQVAEIRRLDLPKRRVLFGASSDYELLDEVARTLAAQETAPEALPRGYEVLVVDEPCPGCHSRRHVELVLEGWRFGVCRNRRDVWLKGPKQNMSLYGAARLFDIFVLGQTKVLEESLRELQFPETKAEDFPEPPKELLDKLLGRR